MAWPTIDPTSPAGTDKVKFGDDQIRSLKQAVLDVLAAISNCTSTGTTPALKTTVWNTVGRPTDTSLVDKVTGYNSDLGWIEYYDLSTVTWKSLTAPSYSTWTVATRPASPYTGQFGYNSDLAVEERWTGTAWVRISGGVAGTVDAFAMLSEPAGYLKCNGQEVSRTTYSDLFNVIGTNYGSGNGSTTFNVPEYRGEFLRGTDDSRGVDVGRTIGSAQAQDVQPHTHQMTTGYVYTSTGTPWAVPSTNNPGTPQNTASTGVTETRPRNVAVLYCIKT